MHRMRELALSALMLSACTHARSSSSPPHGTRDVALSVPAVDAAGLQVGLALRVTHVCGGETSEEVGEIEARARQVMSRHSIATMLTSSGEVSDRARTELQDEVRAAVHDECLAPGGIVLVRVQPPEYLATEEQLRAMEERARAMEQRDTQRARELRAQLAELDASTDSAVVTRFQAQAEAELQERLKRVELDASAPRRP